MLGAAMLTALACSGEPFPMVGIETGAPIHTDRPFYQLETTSVGWKTTIGFTFTNSTRGTVYIANCGGAYGVVLEKRVAGAWVPAWGNIIPACLSAPITIAGGASFTDSLGVFAGFPGSRDHPQFRFDDPQGTYRLVLELLRSFDPNANPFGSPLQPGLRVSNSFEIRVAPGEAG